MKISLSEEGSSRDEEWPELRDWLKGMTPKEWDAYIEWLRDMGPEFLADLITGE